MERQEPETRNESKGSVFLGVLLALAAIVYAMYRMAQNRAYDEKWSDYDECGLS